MANRPVAVEVAEDFPARAARRIMDSLRSVLRQRDVAFVALAGGQTPRPVYRELARLFDSDPEVPRRVHFFWSDERLVPTGDARSNVNAATADLLARLEVPPGRLHPPNPANSPVAAAQWYEREIRRVVGGEPPQFDLILLGLGSDGHTASLFPEDADSELSAADKGALVVATTAPGQPRERISFSFELIAAAREVIFLVSGKGKAEVVSRVLEMRDRSLPAARIAARNGIVRWILDSEAAGGLRQETGGA